MVSFMDMKVKQSAKETSTVKRQWSASLNLAFSATGERTELCHAEHRGPLRVQRLFHPEQDGTAHCYLLHPPGGVVLGDELAISVTAHGGKVLLTSPSAARFYGTGDSTQPQIQRIVLQVDDGILQWLPQETILFPGANAVLDTNIEIAAGSQLVYWEVLVLGMPASGQSFNRGQVLQRLLIQSQGRPLLKERLQLGAGDRLSQARLGLAGESTLGTFVATFPLERDARADWLEQARRCDGAGEFSLTNKGELLIARYRGNDALLCRQSFSALWQQLRQASSGERPQEPRIWHT